MNTIRFVYTCFFFWQWKGQSPDNVIRLKLVQFHWYSHTHTDVYKSDEMSSKATCTIHTGRLRKKQTNQYTKSHTLACTITIFCANCDDISCHLKSKVNIWLNTLHLWVLAVSCLVVVKLLTHESSSRNYSELFVILLINLNHLHAQLPPANDPTPPPHTHRQTGSHHTFSIKVQYLKQLTFAMTTL